MAAPSLRRLLLVAAVLSPAGAAVPTSSSRGSDLGAATSCDARQRGAKGDGKADDAKHLQAALDDPRCDTVVLTANHTFLSSALHVQRSGVTLTIEGGAMLAGKDGAIKQCEAEADWRGWCSFLTVDAERDFVLNGSGTLAGGGNHGEHWSTLHVRSTVGVRLGDGLRIYCTNSWWCTVMHNASAVHATQLFIDGKTGRDGLDLVNSRDILVEDSRIEGSDDGLCFKTQADDGLGAWPARNVTVRRSYLSSECCNAIQFGSRTEVDMSEFSFEDLVIGSGE
jgi:polygalacturonase